MVLLPLVCGDSACSGSGACGGGGHGGCVGLL